MVKSKEEVEAEQREQSRGQVNLATKISLVSKGIDRLISTLVQVDKMQQSALSMGMNANTVMRQMGDKIEGHPGGMRVAFESALDLMKAGLLDHSKGMINLVNQAKVTGQNWQLIIASMQSLTASIPISVKGMTKLGGHVQGLSRTWGIQTTDLMDALKKHAKTLMRISALGGDPVKAAKAITNAIGEATQAGAPAIRELAEKFTFKDPTQDLGKMMLHLGGDEDLVRRVRTEDMSLELLKKLNATYVKTYDQLVMSGSGDKIQTGISAKGLQYDLEFISGQKALLRLFQESKTSTERKLKDNAVDFSASISTMLKELLGPLQVMLLPTVSAITAGMLWLKTNLGGFLGPLLNAVSPIVGLLGTFLILKRIGNMLQLKTMLMSMTPMGLLVGGIATIGMLLYNMDDSNKKIAENEDRTKRAQMKAAGDNTMSYKRYLTGGLIAAQLTSQNEFVTIADSQKRSLDKILFAISRGNSDRLDGQRGATNRLVGGDE